MGKPDRITQDLLPHAVPIDSLQPDPENARKRTEKNLAAIRASFETFGQQRPLLVYVFKTGEKPTVISGNGSYLSARSLGWTKIAAVHFRGTAKEARAYAIADNRTAELSTWDTAVLQTQSLAARTSSTLAGLMDALDLSTLLPAAPTYVTEDEVPIEPPAEPTTRPGDLWKLGPHRVLCGNALSLADVSRVLEGENADCVWTDPPYGVAIVGGSHALTPKERAARGGKKIDNDNLSTEAFGQFLNGAFDIMVRALKPGGSIYVAHTETEGVLVRAAFAHANLKLSNCLIWKKNSLVMGRKDYQQRHEPILYGWKPGAGHRWFGGRDKTTVFEADRPSASADHPTVRPLWLIAQMLVNSARPGDLVLDPFGGSGSTLMACDSLGIRCATVELEPKYVDVIVARWERRTGAKAELA